MLVPAVLFVIGQIFIVTSTWSLGITGRFLGDYFGIIMDARVETFPYNVFHNLIYVGSTMCFAAMAFWCVPGSRSLGSLGRTRATV
jgi:methylene-fatty-acyl-phospholipid synthase